MVLKVARLVSACIGLLRELLMARARYGHQQLEVGGGRLGNSPAVRRVANKHTLAVP